MSSESQVLDNHMRYSTLGLIANPFVMPAEAQDFDALNLEVNSEVNVLLRTVLEAVGEDSPKPIVVNKVTNLPSYYHRRGIGRMQEIMVSDESLNVLHAYVPMFLMRVGRVRATLRSIAERLAFREFDKTLAAYIQRILDEPDEALISYQVLGADRLAEYATRFAEDAERAVFDLYGSDEIIERRPELAEVGDIRSTDLEPDVEEEDSSPEIDSTIKDAPGSEVVVLEEALAREEEDPDQEFVDYILEYTKTNLSPVVARAIRIYRERGLQALSNELTITKAPRKTLAAVVKFARARFGKVVFIYDGFDGWIQVPPERRTQIASTLSEIRWTLEHDALLVMMLEEGQVAELEEQFASGTQVRWTFEGVFAIEKEPDAAEPGLVDRWLVDATLADHEPLTTKDSVLSRLLESSEGSLRRFTPMAFAAVESAATRGVAHLDEQALDAGLSAVPPEEDVSE